MYIQFLFFAKCFAAGYAMKLNGDKYLIVQYSNTSLISLITAKYNKF